MLRLPAAPGLLALLLLAPLPSRAGSGALSLSQALALARQRAPAVVEAQARVDEARGRVSSASPLLAHNPTLEAAAGPRTEDGASRGVDVSVGLSQTLEVGGKRGARRAEAGASLAQARALAEEAERQAVRDVATAFLQALHARARVQLAQENLEAAEAVARAAQRRLEAGDVPALDANVARVGLARAHADLAQAEGAEAGALADLRQLLVLPPSEPLVPTGDVASAVPLRPLDAAPSAPPQVRALEAELEEAQASARAARAEAVPDVTLGVAYEKEAEERILRGALSVPLPLFQRGTGARATASARVRRLEGTLAAARNAQAVALQAAQLQHRKAQAASEALEAQALPLLEDSLALAAKAYAAGEMGLGELLLVRRDALETRAAVLDRRLDAALARIHLASLLGALP